MGRIILILLSDIGEHVLPVLKQGLKRGCNRSVEVRVQVGKLEHAYDPRRGQYLSPRLLSRLRRIKKDRSNKIVGLVDVDLYSPDFDFVFGEADIGAGVATVSLHRLRPEYYAQPPDATVLEERAVKEVTHELGHLYGIGHCQNPKCVMHFSTSLGDVDTKKKKFCATCKQLLNRDQ